LSFNGPSCLIGDLLHYSIVSKVTMDHHGIDIAESSGRDGVDGCFGRLNPLSAIANTPGGKQADAVRGPRKKKRGLRRSSPANHQLRWAAAAIGGVL
jgi:hypothetical protein